MSGGASTRLRFVAGYFGVTGAFSLLLLLLAFGTALLGSSSIAIATRAAIRAHPFGALLRLLMIAISFTTAWLLGERSRWGGALALLVFALPLAERLAGRRIPTLDLAAGAIGLVLMLSVWRELQAGLPIALTRHLHKDTS